MQERIIQFLKEAEGYVSGEEMSQQLNMSRQSLWKYMQELRAQGYDIAAVPHLGYQLISAPDKLLAQEILFGLKTRFMGQEVHAFDSLGSTMDEAFRLGMEGASEGTIVCAESQTKGRGRLGRVWVSPKGKGIYCSIVLRPKLPAAQMPQMTLMTAVALSEAVRKMSGLQPQIKWPNDLLIKGRKLAGILTELRAEVDRVSFVVVGIGLNVNATDSQLLDTATSLKMETEGSFSRVEMLQEILLSLEEWYGRILKGRFEDVLVYSRKHSATLKRRVRVSGAGVQLEGQAVEIDPEGALLIRQDDGRVTRTTAGDVLAV